MATRKSSSAKRSEVVISPPAAGESVEIPGSGAQKRTRRAVNGTATTKSADTAVAKPAKTTRKKSVTATAPEIAPVETTPAAAVPPAKVQEVDLNRYEEEIARLAYHLWEQRGFAHGYHEEDWYRAQEEIKRRYSGETRQTMAAVAGAK